MVQGGIDKMAKKQKKKKLCPACKKAELEDVTDARLTDVWEYECSKCGYGKTIILEDDGSTWIQEYYPA